MTAIAEIEMVFDCSTLQLNSQFVYQPVKYGIFPRDGVNSCVNVLLFYLSAWLSLYSAHIYYVTIVGLGPIPD